MRNNWSFQSNSLGKDTHDFIYIIIIVNLGNILDMRSQTGEMKSLSLHPQWLKEAFFFVMSGLHPENLPLSWMSVFFFVFLEIAQNKVYILEGFVNQLHTFYLILFGFSFRCTAWVRQSCPLRVFPLIVPVPTWHHT